VPVGFVDDVFVDFVRDDIDVIPASKLGDDVKLIAAKDSTRRVGRVAKHEGPSSFLEGLLQFIGVEPEARWPMRHIDRFRPCQESIGGVVLVEGGEDNNFVPGLQTVIRATIMASVLPQVTVMWASGSKSRPIYRRCLSARAHLKAGAPHVTAYWWYPSCKAQTAASTRASGGPKSANP
jgi:hypothetical protein